MQTGMVVYPCDYVIITRTPISLIGEVLKLICYGRNIILLSAVVIKNLFCDKVNIFISGDINNGKIKRSKITS